MPLSDCLDYLPFMPRLIKEAWECIGASLTVLQWIEEGVPLQFKSEPVACELPNRVEGVRQCEFVDREVSELLHTKVIREVSRSQVKCILPIKCILKKHHKFRLVLDCRHINEQIECPKFSQEGLQGVADQILDKDELISIDLKNGFHHLDVM